MSDAAQPKISVVIPWCNRPELARTLRQNWPMIRDADAELIVVNCAGHGEQLQELVREANSPGVRIVELTASGFNKALALNLGMERSRAPYFFSLDSDVILSPGLVEEMLGAISGKQAFLTVAWMHESEPPTSPYHEAMRAYRNDYLLSFAVNTSAEIAFSDGSVMTLPIQRDHIFTGARFGCGLLLARKEDLLRIGGYHSELHRWGWEDLDIQVRLKKYLKLEHLQVGEVCHLTHGDEYRNLNGQDKRGSNMENLTRSFARYSKGDFLGSFEADRLKWEASLSECLV